MPPETANDTNTGIVDRIRRTLADIPTRVKRILALPNDSIVKTIFVAAALSLVCSIVVSGSAVLLKPKQLANKAIEQKRNILEVAGVSEPGKSIDALFSERIEAKVVDLATGEYVEGVDPNSFDARRAVKDPGASVKIPSDQDLAQIRTRAKYAKVYLVRDDGGIKTVVLPVHGYGLWSTLYGFLALKSDGDTIVGLSFYEHAETPGLGGEVDNPRWKSLWDGKHVYGPEGNVMIEVIKGNVDPQRPGAEFQVDGLAGATLTARGVTGLLRYWLGENGFGPYLEKIRSERRQT